jgi:Flp pilus assembly protein TadB
VASTHQHPRDGRPEPVLITEAEPSLLEQVAQRKRRYALMMGIRAASVVLAVLLLHVIPLWAVLTLAVLGTFLPGFAVVMANDRPPKKRQAVPHYEGRPERQLQNRPNRVIDGE